MIGTTQIDYEVLKTFVGRPSDLVAYVESLVPTWARHIQPIVMNQRLYIAIHLRRVLTIPYKPRMELVNALISGITIKGTSNSFTAITDIVDSCDRDTLVAMLKQEVLEHG